MLHVADLESYIDISQDQLTHRYAKVCTLLSQERGLLGDIKSQEHKAKVDTFWENDSTSVAARNRAAEFASCEITNEVTKTYARIDQLAEERDFIIHIMEWRRYAVREGV